MFYRIGSKISYKLDLTVCLPNSYVFGDLMQEIIYGLFNMLN